MEPMHPSRVLVTQPWPEACEARLKAHYAVDLTHSNTVWTPADLKSAMREYDAILPTIVDGFSAEVFSSDPLRCRFLGNFGVGFNHIDLDAARQRGITVTNTPDILTDCTADLVMMLLLMTARRATEGESMLRRGLWTGWNPTQLLGTQVAGKTLGLVGFGRIAKATARRAHFGFGMKIRVAARRPIAGEDLALFDAAQADSLETLMSSVDFVSLHCPGSIENRHLINADRLALMKPEGILINTARGDVIDTAALIEVLQKKQIRAAGLDVYEGEPTVDPRLLTLDNVTLLPHLGSASVETRTGMGMRAIDNLDAFFRGAIPPDRVN